MKFDLIEPMPNIYIRLTHSKKKMLKWNRLFGSGDNDMCELFGKSDAFVNSYFNDDAFVVFIVYMTPDLERAAADDAALLAHEAVHVARRYFENIGETKPSSELEAYTVQAISAYLIKEHFEWKQRKFNRRSK